MWVYTGHWRHSLRGGASWSVSSELSCLVSPRLNAVFPKEGINPPRALIVLTAKDVLYLKALFLSNVCTQRGA